MIRGCAHWQDRGREFHPGWPLGEADIPHGSCTKLLMTAPVNVAHGSLSTLVPVYFPSIVISVHSSQQVEIVQLIPIFLYVSFHFAPINPCHKILHSSRHKVRRIRHHFRPHSHMPLLDKLHPPTNSLCHPQSCHHDCQPASRKSTYRHLPLYLAKLSAVGEDACVIKLF